LLQMFHFGSSVKSIDKRNDGKNGWVLTIEETKRGNANTSSNIPHHNKAEKNEHEDAKCMKLVSMGIHVYEMTFDFVVVCTGTFTNPYMLVHPGQDKFANSGGLVKHSSEYKDMDICRDIEGKRVIIIGGSKSATDIAVHAVKEGRAQQVILLYRRNVWRVPYFVGGINFKHLLYMRAQEIQFTDSWNANTCDTDDLNGATSSSSPSLPLSFLSNIASFMKKKMYWANFRVLEGLLNFQLGSQRKGMLPNEKIEDVVSCNLPVVTEGLMQCIDDGSIRPIHSTLKYYEVINDNASNEKTTANTKQNQMYAVLNNDEKIEIDNVIQATGWTMGLPFFSRDLKDKLIDDHDGLYRLYRFAVNPDLPNLGFVGFNSSFCTVLSSEMIANWLVRYADGMLIKNGDKTKDEMRANINRMLDWKRRVRPAASVYGGNCVAPFLHLHFDEILNDVGATLSYDSMFGYPDAEKFGKCLDSAPKYKVQD